MISPALFHSGITCLNLTKLPGKSNTFRMLFIQPSDRHQQESHSWKNPTLSLPDLSVAFQNTGATYLLIKIPTKQCFSLYDYFPLLFYVLLNVTIPWDLADLCSRKLKTGVTLQHSPYASFTSTPRIRYKENKQLLSIANYFPKQILASGYTHSAATFPLPVRTPIQKYPAKEIIA